MNKSAVHVQPYGDRIVVRREETKAKSDGGIILPENAKRKPHRGTVVAVGELEGDGIDIGETVLFTQYAGTKVEIDGETFIVLREEDVIGIVT